jgi:hypothetical protein
MRSRTKSRNDNPTVYVHKKPDKLKKSDEDEKSIKEPLPCPETEFLDIDKWSFRSTAWKV